MRTAAIFAFGFVGSLAVSRLGGDTAQLCLLCFLWGAVAGIVAYRMMRPPEARRRMESEMLADSDRIWFGYDLSRAAGVRPGLMYPILKQWLDRGYIVDGWYGQTRGPDRRGYRLTDAGVRVLQSGGAE